MRFNIQKNTLLKHINIAQKAVSSRSSSQLLEGIVFECDEQFLTLTSTDLELSIETKVKCDILEKGTTVVNSNIIGNIVKKMPDDIIEFQQIENMLKIKCQNSVFEINTQTSDSYPALPDMEEQNKFLVDANDLTNAIRETIFATSDDENRLAITGILFEINEDNFKFVGIDGYRIAIKSYDKKNLNTYSCIVPKRAFNELSKIVEDGTIEIYIIKGHILFKNKETKMYSKLIDKTFLDYTKILSNEYNTSVKVNRNDLINSLERALLLVYGGASSISKISIGDGIMQINSDSEFGKLDEKIYCLQNGENIRIAFNTRFLLDGLKVIDDDEVMLHFKNDISPVTILPTNEANNYIYLVLPIRVSR